LVNILKRVVQPIEKYNKSLLSMALMYQSLKISDAISVCIPKSLQLAGFSSTWKLSFIRLFSVSAMLGRVTLKKCRMGCRNSFALEKYRLLRACSFITFH